MNLNEQLEFTDTIGFRKERNKIMKFKLKKIDFICKLFP